MQTECKVCSPHCILHPACVLLSVCSQHFTLSLHFTPGPHSAFYTDRLSNSPRKQLDTHGPSVLNIYMGKPEIPVEKNLMVRVNPFEKLPKKGGCDLRRRNFSTPFSLFRLFGYTLQRVVFPTTSNFIVKC